MITIIIGLSLFFVAIGFIVTEKNAKHLLSGYNMMSEEDRKKVNIKEYIPYFRRFHIFLGVSFLLFGVTLTYFINGNAGAVFMAVYPIAAYIFFILTSSRYTKGQMAKWNKLGIWMLIVTLFFVVGLLGYGFKENRITYNSETIEFKGIYRETLHHSEIQSIELTDQLPKIMHKTNGFALGTIKKGYFKTENGQIVKLILNSDHKPYILFTKTNGQKIYYSAKEESNEKLFVSLKN